MLASSSSPALVIVFLIGLYFVPSIVAIVRKVPDQAPREPTLAKARAASRRSRRHDRRL